MTQEHIDNSIANALMAKSNIDKDILDIRGFSTPTMRHLWNNITNTDKEITYLEIGLFCGATFVSSFNKNTTSIGVEDHSQDFSEGFDKVKQELKDNLNNFSNKAKEVKVHYEDCFAIDKSSLPKNIDILFFDGFHSFETQRDALPYFFDNMADEFIFLVDDVAWEYVFEGTAEGFSILKDKMAIKYARLLTGELLNNDPIWHNSVAVYLIKKK